MDWNTFTQTTTIPVIYNAFEAATTWTNPTMNVPTNTYTAIPYIQTDYDKAYDPGKRVQDFWPAFNFRITEDGKIEMCSPEAKQEPEEVDVNEDEFMKVLVA